MVDRKKLGSVDGHRNHTYRSEFLSLRIGGLPFSVWRDDAEVEKCSRVDPGFCSVRLHFARSPAWATRDFLGGTSVGRHRWVCLGGRLASKGMIETNGCEFGVESSISYAGKKFELN